MAKADADITYVIRIRGWMKLCFCLTFYIISYFFLFAAPPPLSRTERQNLYSGIRDSG